MPTAFLTVTNDLSQDQRMHRIASTLASAGFEVTLVGRKLPSSISLTEQMYTQHRIECKYQTGKRFYWEYNQKLTAFLKKAQPDIINSVDLDTLWAGYRAAKSKGAKLVYDAHEYFHETPEVVHRPLIRWVWQQVGARLIPETDARYTVGPALASELTSLYQLPFQVVRNLPYRQTQTSKSSSSSQSIMLYQGMLNRGRGLEVAIEALTHLQDWQLWIAGKGDLEEDFRRWAHRLGVDGRISWLGFVPPEELPGITRQAHLGLNLLTADSPSYYYSLANKTFDYIQAGLPAIHMAFPEYKRIQEAYGGVLLLEELTVDAFVGLVRSLHVYTHMYEELQNQCLAAAEVLNWEMEEDKLLRIYQNL